MALTDNIVSYRKMNTNGSFPDSVGSNDGTINGATYTASWKIDWWYNFNGSNQYITTTRTNLPSGNWACTYNIWVKAASITWYRTPRFVWAELVNQWLFFATDWAGNGWKISVWVYGAERILSTGTIGTGAWNMITLTHDGSVLRLYINWNADNTYTGSIAVTNSIHSIWRIWAATGQYWSWDLDEYGIWTRALSAAEITTLYNSWAGKTYPFASTDTWNFLTFF